MAQHKGDQGNRGEQRNREEPSNRDTLRDQGVRGAQGGSKSGGAPGTGGKQVGTRQQQDAGRQAAADNEDINPDLDRGTVDEIGGYSGRHRDEQRGRGPQGGQGGK